MARCEECIHHEVCDIISAQYGISKIYPSQCYFYKPTADVAPRAEVERLTVELQAMRGAANSYKMHYENAKAEVAREIFEEIEKYMVVFGDVALSSYFRGIGWKTFAELKKKYTEENNQ